MSEKEKIEAMKECLHRIGALYDAVGIVAKLRGTHDNAALVAAVDALYDMIKAEWRNHAQLQASLLVRWTLHATGKEPQPAKPEPEPFFTEEVQL